jgi:IS30 family transposase
MGRRFGQGELTQAEREKIIKFLRETEMSFATIGQRLGRSRDTISRVNEESGARPSVRGNEKNS